MKSTIQWRTPRSGWTAGLVLILILPYVAARGQSLGGIGIEGGGYQAPPDSLGGEGITVGPPDKSPTPTPADTDHDGYYDRTEKYYGTNPRNPADYPADNPDTANSKAYKALYGKEIPATTPAMTRQAAADSRTSKSKPRTAAEKGLSTATIGLIAGGVVVAGAGGVVLINEVTGGDDKCISAESSLFGGSRCWGIPKGNWDDCMRDPWCAGHFHKTGESSCGSCGCTTTRYGIGTDYFCR